MIHLEGSMSANSYIQFIKLFSLNIHCSILKLRYVMSLSCLEMRYTQHKGSTCKSNIMWDKKRELHCRDDDDDQGSLN